MTGYTVHTGASKKFVSGWDRIFTGPADAAESSDAAAKQSGKSKKKAKKASKTRKKKS